MATTGVSKGSAKGARLQRYVAKKIQGYFKLDERDVRSTASGVTGTDITLSAAAVAKFPFAVECKNLKNISIYKYMRQAKEHTKNDLPIPLVIVHQNYSEELAVVNLDFFLTTISKYNGKVLKSMYNSK